MLHRRRAVRGHAIPRLRKVVPERPAFKKAPSIPEQAGAIERRGGWEELVKEHGAGQIQSKLLGINQIGISELIHNHQSKRTSLCPIVQFHSFP
ncbi:MAG: hypothetical protein OXC57_13030 [Rhodobacteraceae bacterium]|nr:hypothetical protein [Paracoccaceae bacterium]